MRTLCAAMALAMFSPLANATPVEYSFELTVTTLHLGERPDPGFADFHLGQTFYGTFTYDSDAAMKAPIGPGYIDSTSLSVQFGDTLMTTSHGFTDYRNYRTRVQLNDGDAGTDWFSLTEEVPQVSGGYIGSFVAEHFSLLLIDDEGTAFTGTVPAPIDFTQFDTGRWSFNTEGRPSLYSGLIVQGTVGNIRQVPEPSTLWLAGIAIACVGSLHGWRRQRRPASGMEPCYSVGQTH